MDQLSGSRGSEDGRGISAFSALKSACTASVPGMGSRLSWCVISPHRMMFLQEVELVKACVCPEGRRSGFQARFIPTGWQMHGGC